MTSSLAALTLLLAVPTVSAEAQSHAPAETGIAQAFLAGAPTPRAGRFTFNATLLAANVPVVGVPLVLSIKEYDATAFTDRAVVTTDAEGKAAASVRLLKRAQVTWRFDGTPAYAASTTRAFTQRVGTRATIHVSDRTPAVGQWVVVRGKTVPPQPGRRVWLFRGFSPHGAALPPQPDPILLSKGKVHKDGTYKVRVRFPGAGDRRLFVDVAKGGGNARGYSHAVVVHVH